MRRLLSRLRQLFKNFLIVILAFILTSLFVEIIIRIAGETDADGQFYFMERALPPYHLPVDKLHVSVESYIEEFDRVTILYDATMGWLYRPNSTRQNGEFTINAAGIRSQREFSQEPLPDTLRIALFGDSFTAAEEVGDEEAWGYLLEVELEQMGIQAEVLNFGVGGYGMDQAYLRWQNHGMEYAPDMVIFGFHPADLNRNLNIFRPLLFTNTILPFSKPRFIFDQGELLLVNSPAVPPEELVGVYQSFYEHPLAADEYFYRGREGTQWWASSKFIALIANVMNNPQDDNRAELVRDRAIMGQAIVDSFAEDVIAQQAEFFVLHLPNQENVQRWLDGSTLNYQSLLDHFDESYHYIALEDYLLPDMAEEQYWASAGHFAAELNQLTAEVVAKYIQNCIQSRECKVAQFTGS